MIDQFIGFVAGSSLALVVLGFLARSIILHFLGKDLEKYKLELKTEAEKSQLVFNRFHERKLDIISVLYERSVEAANATKYAVQMQGNIEESEIPVLEKKVKNFKEQYELARLWLDDECSEAIDQLLEQNTAFYKVINAAQLRKNGLGSGWVGKEFLKLWEDAESKLPKAQQNLKRVFQQALKSIKP